MGEGIRKEGEVGWSSWEDRLRRALKGMQSICFAAVERVSLYRIWSEDMTQ